MKHLLTETQLSQDNAQKVTVDKIKALPTYRKLLEAGIDITDEDLKFVFAIDPEHIYDKEGKNDVLRGFYGAKIDPGFRRGNVKTYFSSGEIERAEYFDSNLMGGWESALKEVTSRLSRVKSKLESKGFVILSSKEEIHKKRGLIIGRKFGF